jgi:hypothetical protein
MIIIKTTSDEVVLFDSDSLYIFNQKDLFIKDRLIIGFLMLGFAFLGIYFQPSYKINFFLISWILLFLTWVFYIVKNLRRNNYPERLIYPEIVKIEVSYNSNGVYLLQVYSALYRKPIVLFTREFNDDFILFMHVQKVSIIKTNF